MKTTFFHGITAGILTGLAACAYNYAYSSALLVDFSKIINPVSIFGSAIFGCVLASFGYYFISKWLHSKAAIWFNFIFVGLTFASLIGSFAVELPSEVQSPELFAGLSVPMHIFPVLFWLAVKPLFSHVA
jgi:hypothetical protein